MLFGGMSKDMTKGLKEWTSSKRYEHDQMSKDIDISEGFKKWR